MQKKTIKLKFPFDFGSEHVTEIEINRPKAKDFRGVNDLKSMDGMLRYISNIIGKPDAFVNKIDAADFNAIGEAVSDFLETGPETGENVS